MSNSLDVKIEKLREKLKSSKTAVGAGVQPTKSDIQAEKDLRSAKAEKSRNLGKSDVVVSDRGEEASKPSAFNRVLNFLNAPVAAGAGVLETALGQGSEDGLLENVRANIREGSTYGDVLRQGGASNWIAMPVGFALDVALDPVNWATMGTAAFVPKVGKGVVKGGAKGLKVAAKAAASEKIDNMLGAISAPYRKHLWEGTPIRGRLGSVMEKVATTAKKSNKEYNELVEGGVSALERLTKEQQTQTEKLISKIGDALNEKKPGTTKWLKKNFWGDDKKWLDESKLAEDLRNAPDGPAVEKARINKQRSVAASHFEEGDMLAKGDLPSRSASSADNQAKMATALADDMEDSMEFQARLEGHIERYLNDGSDAAKELRAKGQAFQEDYLSTFATYKADVEGYDKAVAKTLLNGTAQKFFKGHARLMGMFKANVIGLSIPARVNQAIGNFAAFVPISGINPFNTGFTNSISRAAKFSYTQNLKYIKEMLTDEQVLSLLNKYPDTFTKVMGIKAEFLTEGTQYLRRRMAQLAKEGGKNSKAIDEALSYISRFEDDVAKKAGLKSITKEMAEETLEKAGKQARKEAVAPFQSVTQFDTSLGNTNLTQEFVIGQVSKWHKELAKKAANGDKGAEVLHWLLTKPLEDYGRGDQIFKLGMMMHTTKNGISQGEMKILQKWYKFKPGDIIESKNGLRYKLTPEASMDVASSMFLNYSAMPSWSKIARSLPFIGAPFACRDEDTEILTENGFKRYNEVKIGEMALSLNTVTKEFEWKPITDVHVYDFNGSLVHLKHRSLDIRMTNNHRLLVGKKRLVKEEKNNGRRIRKPSNWEISYKTFDQLVNKDSIVVGAEKCYVPVKEKEKNVSDDLVELVGWYVTEGSVRERNKDGSPSRFCISQSKPDGRKKIESLRKRLGVDSYVHVRTAEKHNAWQNRNSFSNYDCYVYDFPARLQKKMCELAPDKQLTSKFITSLTYSQLVLLYETLILADGSRRRSGRDVFIQNGGETHDSFQLLCLLLGKTSTSSVKPNSKCRAISVCSKVYRQTKRVKAAMVSYNGKVWCPEVEHNGNWVARRNGKIDVTGNSFMAGAQKNVLRGVGYNLSYFNKVRNLIHEVSGEKGPMEKEALESPYYDHITSNPAMVKLPFFKENPVYLNLGNALHVFDSNLLDEPGRDYESKYGKEFVSLIDKSPFLKDPTGQFILNYAVLPFLLGEAIGPFNNELYSEDDTTAQKVGKSVTGAIEPFMPKTPGTGLAALPIPEEQLPYVPSYGARRFKNATLGKGPTGRNSSESAESKTIRAGFAEVGLPVYRLNLNTGSKK